jgi:hypothetical protein
MRCWVNVFCVMELEKMRRRIVAEPFLNDVCYGAWSLLLAMPGVDEQLAAIHYDGATVADYPWFYGQMPLGPAAMLFFGFLAWHKGEPLCCAMCRQVGGGSQAWRRRWHAPSQAAPSKTRVHQFS